MIYRKLAGKDRAPLAGIFKSFNCTLPESGFILAGYDDRTLGAPLACFQTFHQVNHAGPVWVRPDLRGRGLWLPLQSAMERELPSGTYYYQFGTDANESQLDRMNLSPLGWRVWGKTIGG